MLISTETESAINEQVGHEFGASLQYVSIAAFFESRNLSQLAAFFFKQAEEEREHALKLVDYLVKAGAQVRIPALPAPMSSFSSEEEAVKLACDWELNVTDQFNALMRQAVNQQDYLTQTFLAWFVTEQLEEVSSMTRLLDLIRRAGSNLFMVEAYLVHGE